MSLPRPPAAFSQSLAPKLDLSYDIASPFGRSNLMRHSPYYFQDTTYDLGSVLRLPRKPMASSQSLAPKLNWNRDFASHRAKQSHEAFRYYC